MISTEEESDSDNAEMMVSNDVLTNSSDLQDTDDNDSDHDNIDLSKLDKFNTALGSLQDAVGKDYESNEKLRKGIATLTNQIVSAVKGGSLSVEEYIFKITQQATTQTKQGKKKKNSSVIPTQQTAKSRRKFQSKGGSAPGRKPKNTALKRKMIVDEDQDGVYYQLPSSSSSQKKHKQHSLKAMVEENRSSAKKH